MNRIVLQGCTPSPLLGYLKALGVLRLLSQSFPAVRAAWCGEHIALVDGPSHSDLEQFFMRDYSPTPILAPWNGGSGFYFRERKSRDIDPTTGKRAKLGIRNEPTEATRTIDAVLRSSNMRFLEYRIAIEQCKLSITRLDLEEPPSSGPEKDRFLLTLRGSLPESFVEWMDAALLITSEGARYPPLLGTGGNDGNLDFTNNFMQRLGEVLSFSNDEPSQESIQWLRMALYGEPAPGLVKKAIGQFSPGQVGGPNGTIGFEADSAVNPWDFVLMIEGALPFAATAVRRSADDPEGVLSFPFTVRAVGAGYGGLGEGDAARARGELWMPLWRRPATYPEVRALLSEGRVALGRKPARDALDFVRAVHRLGSYRGIDSFQRYGLLMRSGKAYLATPLARVDVTENARADWLDDLDVQDWLTRFRRFAQGENVPERFLALRRRLEEAMFALAGRDLSAAEAQGLVILLAEIEAALAASTKTQEYVPPVPRLSERWVFMADDGTAAFRIARAMAGLTATKDQPLPMLAQLLPIHPVHNVWVTPEYRGKHATQDVACRVRINAEIKGSLVERLICLLSDRLRFAREFDMRDEPEGTPLGKPLRSPAGIGVDDLLAFLRSNQMDSKIAALMPGLCLCNVPRDTQLRTGEGVFPAAFALLKLCLTPDAILRDLHVLDARESLPVPPGLLAQLRAGNAGNRAVVAAWRRLVASGLSPVMARGSLPELGELDPRRAAAALLIPLRTEAVGVMSRGVLIRTGPFPSDRQEGELV